MRFAYCRHPLGPDGELDDPRPYLDVRVLGTERSADTQMLVDSGSAETMLPKFFLDALGAQYSGEKARVTGFAGGDFPEAEVTTVRLLFGRGRFELRTRVLAFPGVCIPVLGHRDFFLRYYVAFDAARGEFVVAEPARYPRIH